MSAEPAQDLGPASGGLTPDGPLTRRRLIGIGAGAAAVGLATGAGVTYAGTHNAGSGGGSAPPAEVPFRAAHQAGIVTPAQDRMHFVALDVVTRDRHELRDLLKAWTRAAERMVAGAEAAPGGVVGGGPHRAPADTGEAFDLDAAGLTITIGFGPSLFDDRFGLAAKRPDALRDLPPFAGDALDPARSGGDLCIQACADDPQVAVHAVRNLVRMGFGTVAVRWSQLGFGRTSSTTRKQKTPRNLFGFKDGTNNLKAEDTADLDEHVWVHADDVPGGASWMVGGTFLVARRIRMHIEVWDRATLQEQQDVIGRDKAEGAPLGQRHETDPMDFTRTGASGQPAIPADAHVRLAHESRLGGIRILRRGYNFTDGSDGLGHLDAGLFFVAFMRDAHQQFVPMQRVLASKDGLNEYIEHTGSALFACPPGVSVGQDWGGQLFA